MVDLSTNAGQTAINDLMSAVSENNSSINAQDRANSILTNLSTTNTPNPDGVRALTSAITVLKNLAQRNDVTVSTESLMGMFTGGMGNN